MGLPVFSFFLSIKALDSLLRSKTYRHMLIKQDVRVYLDASAEELLPHLNQADDSYIGNFLMRQCQGDFALANEFIADLLESPNKIAEHPYSIFVLGVSSSDAKKIRDNYGVLFFSDSANPRFPQIRYKKSVFCREGNSAHSWETIFSELSRMPRNTIIINDRYLLGSLSDYAVDGMKENLGEIMHSLLPSNKFSGTVQVVVLFDAIDKSWTTSFTEPQERQEWGDVETQYHKMAWNQFEKRARIIDQVIHQSAKGPYNINVICVSFFRGLKQSGDKINVKTWVEGYQFTHNRRILSDYHFTTAEYGLVAFRVDGSPEKEQSISIKGLYSEGLDDCSDTPIERHCYELRQMAEWAQNGIYKNLMISVNGEGVETESIPATLCSVPLLRSDDTNHGVFPLKKRKS